MALAGAGYTLLESSNGQLRGPAVLAARPCGFSRLSRPRWSAFRSISGEASRPGGLPVLRAVNSGPSFGSGRGLAAIPNKMRSPAPASAYMPAADEPLRSFDQEAAETRPSAERPPRLLWWCRSAEEESRLLTYSVNGSLIFLALLASASQLTHRYSDHISHLAILSSVQGLVQHAWHSYNDALEANPLATKACISGMVYGLGDLTAQTYEGRSLGDMDAGRILRSSLCGFIAHGPLSHFYYQKLDREFVLSPFFNGGDAWYTPLCKVVVDQTVWSVCWNSLYYILLGIMKFESPYVIAKTVQTTWWDVLKAGWRLWPIAHLVTYSIPRDHRVLWVDMVELVWVTVLSLYGQQKREKMGAEFDNAHVSEVVPQVSCVLPSAPGEGGDFAEEIMRGLQREGEIVFVSADGETKAVAAIQVYSEAAILEHQIQALANGHS